MFGCFFLEILRGELRFCFRQDRAMNRAANYFLLTGRGAICPNCHPVKKFTKPEFSGQDMNSCASGSCMLK